MSDQENPGTRHVRLITDEVMALLKDAGRDRLTEDSKIVLASVLFADNEGVAHIEAGKLSRWCANPGFRRAGRGFLQRRIDHLVKGGALAPGSTPEELRSMVGRAAYAEAEEVAA